MIESRDKKAEVAALEWLNTELRKISSQTLQEQMPEWWKDNSHQDGATAHPVAESLNEQTEKLFGIKFSNLEWQKIITDYLINTPAHQDEEMTDE